MSSGDASTFAPMKWAQRNDMLYLTFCVEDCKNPEIAFNEKKITFRGTGGTQNKTYFSELELFKEIDPMDCKKRPNAREIFCIVRKKESGPYWPRLLTAKQKHHWLKVDFAHWRDESDSSDDEGAVEKAEPNLSDMMAQLGRGPGSGVDLDNLDDESQSEDSDDEDVPQLEKTPVENGKTEEAA